MTCWQDIGTGEVISLRSATGVKIENHCMPEGMRPGDQPILVLLTLCLRQCVGSLALANQTVNREKKQGVWISETPGEAELVS